MGDGFTDLGDSTSARIRVSLLLSSLHGGGAERVAVHLLNRCDPRIIDVRMGLLTRTGPFVDDADPSRIDVAPLGQKYLSFEGHNSNFYRPDRLAAGIVLAPINLRRMIDAHRPHVVMSFLKGMNLMTGAVVKTMGRGAPRWIVREGNNTDAVIEDELKNNFGRAFIKSATRFAYRRADCFLANSHEMAAGLQQRLDLKADRVRVIHNPIDLARIRRLSQERAPDAPERPYLVTVGRLEHQKAHDVMLKAFAASRAAQGHDLVIVGRGSLEARTRALAAELGIAERVRFTGFVANPWALMARAKMFLLSSRWEGFPSVVAEALACGAPALVTRCDFGPAEVVEHGHSGWVAEVDDIAGFTTAMDDLLDNPALRAQFSRNGLERAQEFDIDLMVERYVRLFVEQAMAARSAKFIPSPAPIAVPEELEPAES